MTEIITIVDPGWDWFQFSVFMSIPVLVGVVALLFALVGRFQSNRSRAEGWYSAAGFTGFAALVVAGISLIAAGITGMSTYSGHQEAATLKALHDGGYNATTLVDTDTEFVLFITGDGNTGTLVQTGPNSWLVSVGEK
ncbi:membrane protein [Microbacterium phage Zooman]|nr:membrane protein [Microbacterium phage Zooman]